MTDEMQKARELALAVLLVGNAPPFEYYKGDTRWDVAMAKCKAENEATLDRVIAAVRAETLREVATRMDEAAKRNLVDGYHETAEAFTMARDITLALEEK
jgi:hypothetical protein